ESSSASEWSDCAPLIPSAAFKTITIVVIQSEEDFMLLINNQEVEKLFTMTDCLAVLEDGYDDLLKGDAVF
ncbi:MAG: hypothetical protein ACM3N3_18165, partial [Betaproteobacteria bacterium]